MKMSVGLDDPGIQRSPEAATTPQPGIFGGGRLYPWQRSASQLLR